MNLDAVDFSTINIIVALPDRSRVSARSGWMRVKHIVDQLTKSPRIAAVRSTVSVNRDAKPWEQIGALPSQFVDTFVSTDRPKALVVGFPGGCANVRVVATRSRSQSQLCPAFR